MSVLVVFKLPYKTRVCVCVCCMSDHLNFLKQLGSGWGDQTYATNLVSRGNSGRPGPTHPENG